METQYTNPLLCDNESGVCEMPATRKEESITTEVIKEQMEIIYFTDPICSSCWGIEPQLRKLKLEYGAHFNIQYRMGGLLKDWAYNSGGISKPGDVAQHWDEVSKYYDMPIDGDIWLQDPLQSSYPPSIAFKAAQMQDDLKAIRFLRRIREMVFLEKKNITKWEYLGAAANEVGLNIIKLKADYQGEANNLFQEDLALARQLGVRGFPTMIFSGNSNKQSIIYGHKPYSIFEEAILKIAPAARKLNYDKTWENLFLAFPTLTAREFAELSGLTKNEAGYLLQSLVDAGELETTTTKNGILWKKARNPLS